MTTFFFFFAFCLFVWFFFWSVCLFLFPCCGCLSPCLFVVCLLNHHKESVLDWKLISAYPPPPPPPPSHSGEQGENCTEHQVRSSVVVFLVCVPLGWKPWFYRQNGRFKRSTGLPFPVGSKAPAGDALAPQARTSYLSFFTWETVFAWCRKRFCVLSALCPLSPIFPGPISPQLHVPSDLSSLRPLLLQPDVPSAPCSLSLMFLQTSVPSDLCSLRPLLPQPDVPPAPCSLSLMFPSALCSLSLMFPQPDVPSALCFLSPVFPQLYHVPSARCSLGPIMFP